MFRNRDVVEWLIALVLVVAGAVVWHLASAPPPAYGDQCGSTCDCSGAQD